MGIGNRTFTGDLMARMGEKPKPIAAPAPPVVDMGGRVAAAQAAADRQRKKAAGSNKPRQAAPGVNLNPSPGSVRLY